MLRIIFLCLALIISNFSFSQKQEGEKDSLSLTITKIEMHLSAFGVESDNFPSIDVSIDLIKDTNNCYKSYYNPKFKASTYRLSTDEIKKIIELIQSPAFEKLKNEYHTPATDLPTATIIIYRAPNRLTIKDYGLEGDYPLQELYRIAYKY